MASEDDLEEWLFSFGLCATKPEQLISRRMAEELLFVITKWAEKHDFGVGGGFRPFGPEDMKPFNDSDEQKP